MSSSVPEKATAERAADIAHNLADIRARVTGSATLVAVSKYKPASDVQACYDAGQRDFGENYVAELAEKAAVLPADVRWHFIGTLQSNKAKTLASIPNLHSVHTLTSSKTASILNRTRAEDTPLLDVYLQINTSGEDAKSGLPPLSSPPSPEDSELMQLARHVLTECPRLRLRGLMTIGALSESLSESEANKDFETLKRTRDALLGALGDGKVEDGLKLSMGMSADFEAALRAGSDVVRVGSSIFGARRQKGEH